MEQDMNITQATDSNTDTPTPADASAPEVSEQIGGDGSAVAPVSPSPAVTARNPKSPMPAKKASPSATHNNKKTSARSTKAAGTVPAAGGSKSRSARSGLQLPVGRVHRKLREGGYAERVGSAAPVYLTGVLEYLLAEVLELAGTAARDNKKQRINPRHIQLAIRNDDELDTLFRRSIIAGGGVMPLIHNALLPMAKRLMLESAATD